MRADARANRQDLLAAAGRLIATQGAAMSLRGVAQEAGVGVGTLYRHFPTRRDLLDAVLEDVVARTGGILQAFLDGVGGDGHGGGTEARWRRLAEDLGAVNLASLAAARDDFDPADRPPEALIAEAERVILELADQVVAEARRAGLVGPDVTGADYLFGLLMVTRSPECALLGHGPALPPPFSTFGDEQTVTDGWFKDQLGDIGFRVIVNAVFQDMAKGWRIHHHMEPHACLS